MGTSSPTTERETSSATPQRGLGDIVGDFFASLGISEERYKAAKATFGLDPNCRCPERRKWLNQMGARLGVDNVIVKLARWLDTRPH